MFVRMSLLWWWPNWICSFLRTRLLWLPPRVPFFSHQRRALLLHVSIFSFWHHSLSLSLSLQKVTPVLTTTLALSPQKVTCSLSSEVPASLPCSPPPATRTLMIMLSLLRKSALHQAGRPHARRWKGKQTSTVASSRADASVSPSLGLGVILRAVTARGRDAASDPPPRPRSPRRKSSSRWKLIAPLLAVLILLCYQFFCVMNYAHLVYGM
jgi:hypothetical protein